VPKNIVVVNKAAFDALDDNVKAIVQKAAAAAEVRGWEMSKQETNVKTAVLTENGMIVVEPSDELLSGLKSIGADMQSAWQESASDDAKAIIESFNQ
jgi:TRAP-type C4-dicarboxylate transport system substrate-binding protein